MASRTRWARPRQLLDLLRRQSEERLPGWCHWVMLVGVFVFLMVISRHRWFNGDEWDFLVNRKLFGGGGTLGLFVPHNEHWTFVPALAYRILFSIFGLRSHLPYSFLIVAAHLAVVELLWRMCRRVRVRPWTALVAVTGFALLGGGAENIINAFEITFVIPLATGLAALLILPATGDVSRRDWIAGALLTIGVACSAVGLLLLAVVAAVQLLRERWRAALACVAVPIVVYVVWYAKYHHQAATYGREPLRTAIQQLPAFVWAGLTDPLSKSLELDGVGAILVVLLAVWAVRRAGLRAEPWPLPTMLALGAPAFLALTGIGRVQYGTSAATAGRYGYTAIALLLPLAALAADALLQARALRPIALIGGVLFLVLVGSSQLKDNADRQAAIESGLEGRVVATAHLARAGTPLLIHPRYPIYVAGITVDRLRTLDRDGKLPAVSVTPADTLTALEYTNSFLGPSLQLGNHTVIVTVGGAAASMDQRPGCVRLDGQSDHPAVRLALDGPVSLLISPQRSGTISYFFEQGAVRGEARESPISGGASLALNAQTPPGITAVLSLPPLGTTTLCNVAGPLPPS